MREGWHTKKLGELGRVITGSTPSTRDEDNYSSPDVCFVKPSDIEKNGITTISNTEFHISHKAFQQSRKLPQGSVLTTCIGIIGKVGILGVDATCNQQINAIVPDIRVITSSFLAYSILSKQHLLSSIANAPVVPIINKGEFSSVAIPVPPIAEQEKIVAELDCLTGIIEKKKQQLKELDNLAQSIFYDMFGDPTTNTKKWTQNTFKEVADFKNGANYSKTESGHFLVKFLSVADFGENTKIEGQQLGTIIVDERLSEELFLQDNDIVFVRSNGSKSMVGRNVLIKTNNEVISFSGFCIRARLKSQAINPLFINRLLNVPSVRTTLTSSGQGCNISNINQKSLGDLVIILPPIDFQNDFAQKMEAIEEQKGLIKKSIQETETLFNSRMDYWFN